MNEEHKKKIGESNKIALRKFYDNRNLGIVCSYCHFAIHDNGRNTRFKEVSK